MTPLQNSNFLFRFLADAVGCSPSQTRDKRNCHWRCLGEVGVTQDGKAIGGSYFAAIGTNRVAHLASSSRRSLTLPRRLFCKTPATDVELAGATAEGTQCGLA